VAAKEEAAAEAQAKAEEAARKKAAHAAAEAAKDPWERDPAVPEWEDADDDPLAQALRQKHPEAIESTRRFAGDLTIEVRREDIQKVCATLKEEQGYLLPVDVCGAHYPDRESGQFEIVYHLYNFEKNRRIRIKTRTEEGVEVPSVTSVWRGANWPEREAYDMFGIRFSGHPDMTRILLWEGFNGFPLRKDFPVEGIDTGSAIYPEYYEDEAGPVAGTGTGWKPPEPPEPEPDAEAEEGPEDTGA
jgi:NADH-quinone oxidoreductase subunit C